jgi:hypothetical protein
MVVTPRCRVRQRHVITRMGLPMGWRPTLMVSALAVSAVALGCSTASPSVQPPDMSSQGPTPTETAVALPTSTPDAGGSPLVSCLGPRPDLAAILAVDPGQRLTCFGRADVTFLAAVAAPTVDCVPVQVEPAWLWCPPAAFLAVPGVAGLRPKTDPLTWASRSALTADMFLLAAAGAPMLEVHVAPSSALDQTQLVPGAIVLVSGHFDDPAAATCRVVAVQPGWRSPTPAEVVLACREAFVATSVGPGST